MSAAAFIGFDPQILQYCSAEQSRKHTIISWMMIINVIIFGFGTYYFFHVSIKEPNLLWLIVLFLSFIYLSFTWLILATHDHDLAYYHHYKKIKPIGIDISVIFKLFIVLFFSLLCGCGCLFWITDALFYNFLNALEQGYYDENPRVLEVLGIMGDNYTSIDNITDRFKVLGLLTGYLSFLLLIPFILTAFIFLLPFVMKFAFHDLSNGEYELKESIIESSLIIADYEYTWNQINHIRVHQFGLPRYRFEAYEDPPYNTVKRVKRYYKKF